MPQIKVKLFQNVLSASPGVDLRSDFSIDKDINAFLSSNANVKFIDVKLSGNAAAVGDRTSNFTLCALLIYEEG